MTSEMQSVRDEFAGAVTEIIAAKVLHPRSEADRAWNDASDRAARLVKAYIAGDGLFQVGTNALIAARAKEAKDGK
jgi:hypothetical protein